MECETNQEVNIPSTDYSGFSHMNIEEQLRMINKEIGFLSNSPKESTVPAVIRPNEPPNEVVIKEEFPKQTQTWGAQPNDLRSPLGDITNQADSVLPSKKKGTGT